MFKPKAKKREFENTNQMGTIVTRLPNSIIAEQFRTIRTNIQFSMVDNSIKSFIVTSARSSSGKTFISANLSSVLATKNKRVLLVDADLRRPTVHKVFGLKNNQGLSNLLTNDQASLSDYTCFDYASGLYILTSGATPHNPSELLGSNRMMSIIEEMNRNFDIIIFDTPPILTVSDAQVLSSKVDGVLFIIPYGQVTREETIKLKAALEKVNANIIGAVINRTKERVNKDSYYYY